MPFGSRLSHIRCSTALSLAASPAPPSTRSQNPKPASAVGSGARRTWQHHIYRESQEDLTENDLQQWLSKWQQQEPVQSAVPQVASTPTLPVSHLYILSACDTALLHAQAMLLHLQVPALPDADGSGLSGSPGQLMKERRSIQQANCAATATQAADPRPAAFGTTCAQVRASHVAGHCICLCCHSAVIETPCSLPTGAPDIEWWRLWAAGPS